MDNNINEELFQKYKNKIPKRNRLELKNKLNDIPAEKAALMENVNFERQKSFGVGKFIGVVATLLGFILLALNLITFSIIFPNVETEKEFTLKVGNDLQKYYYSAVNYGMVNGVNCSEQDFSTGLLTEIDEYNKVNQKYQEDYSKYLSAYKEYNDVVSEYSSSYKLVADEFENYDKKISELNNLVAPQEGVEDYDKKLEEYNKKKTELENAIQKYTQAKANLPVLKDKIEPLRNKCIELSQPCIPQQANLYNLKADYEAKFTVSDKIIIYGIIPLKEKGIVDYLNFANAQLESAKGECASYLAEYANKIELSKNNPANVQANRDALSLFNNEYEFSRLNGRLAYSERFKDFYSDYYGKKQLYDIAVENYDKNQSEENKLAMDNAQKVMQSAETNYLYPQTVMGTLGLTDYAKLIKEYIAYEKGSEDKVNNAEKYDNTLKDYLQKIEKAEEEITDFAKSFDVFSAWRAEDYLSAGNTEEEINLKKYYEQYLDMICDYKSVIFNYESGIERGVFTAGVIDFDIGLTALNIINAYYEMEGYTIGLEYNLNQTSGLLKGLIDYADGLETRRLDYINVNSTGREAAIQVLNNILPALKSYIENYNKFDVLYRFKAFEVDSTILDEANSYISGLKFEDKIKAFEGEIKGIDSTINTLYNSATSSQMNINIIRMVNTSLNSIFVAVFLIYFISVLILIRNEKLKQNFDYLMQLLNG